MRITVNNKKRKTYCGILGNAGRADGTPETSVRSSPNWLATMEGGALRRLANVRSMTHYAAARGARPSIVARRAAILAQAKRRLPRSAGRLARGPKSDRDADSRSSNSLLAASLSRPIVELLGLCRPSTHKLRPDT